MPPSVSSPSLPSPSSLSFPIPGDCFKTREELSTLIKSKGKSDGYIFKCSVTSEYKVTFYCSNKYHQPRCMAGFKAAFDDDSGWVVTEAADHNEACTRARQKVNVKVVRPGDAPSIAVKAPSPTSRTHKSSSIKSRPKSFSTSRVSSFTSRSSSTLSSSRRHRSRSSSAVGTSPPSSTGARSSNTRAVNDEEADDAMSTLEEELDDGTAEKDSLRPARRGSATSSSGRAPSGRFRSGGSRDRSYSSASSHSTRSERSYVTTILDPAYHFPPASLQAAVEIHRTLPVRRKRSSSYIKNAPNLLLGRYLESQHQETQEQEIDEGQEQQVHAMAGTSSPVQVQA